MRERTGSSTGTRRMVWQRQQRRQQESALQSRARREPGRQMRPPRPTFSASRSQLEWRCHCCSLSRSLWLTVCRVRWVCAMLHIPSLGVKPPSQAPEALIWRVLAPQWSVVVYVRQEHTLRQNLASCPKLRVSEVWIKDCTASRFARLPSNISRIHHTDHTLQRDEYTDHQI